jgi:hypothetical protein
MATVDGEECARFLKRMLTLLDELPAAPLHPPPPGALAVHHPLYPRHLLQLREHCRGRTWGEPQMFTGSVPCASTGL